MKTLMVINPVSGKNKNKSELIDALSVFSESGEAITVYCTQQSGDGYRYVAEHGQEFDRVICCGGDGTLNEVTSALIQFDETIPLGYFPAGTMNDFASNFDLSLDWEAGAKRIVNGTLHPFDMGVIDGTRYFNYVAGFGNMTNVSYDTDHDLKEVLGVAAYIVEGLKEVPNIHPIETTITVNGKTETMKLLVGLVFSGNRVSGIEAMSREEGRVDDGTFNILLIEWAESLFDVDYHLVLEHKEGKLVHWYQASEADFEFSEEINWTVDGEKYEGGRTVHIQNIHNALKLIA